MILGWIDEAQAAGARLAPACRVVGLDPRTIQRWRTQQGGDDRRHGPKIEPQNKLTKSERQAVLDTANSAAYRDKSPKQIVPDLAGKGRYIASESTFYRVLREADQMAHRGRAKAPTSRPPAERRATGPLQVWSWDITYLRSPVAGGFFYLYVFVDVWSRKIVAHAVHDRECNELASSLLEQGLRQEGVTDVELVLHADNGAPMKGATFKATMERLGIIPSFSRPRVSDDNPYSEALFRTLKYRPEYPSRPFESLEAARAWVEAFVAWYNGEHLHSAIGYVTPSDRHAGRADAVLERRRAVYQAAKQAHPERWGSRPTRTWEAPQEVFLNPTPDTRLQLAARNIAA
jgi:transposase InsO family protein